MSTQTLAAEARRNVVLFLNGGLDGFRGQQRFAMLPDPSGESTDQVQVLELVDVPVFRSGTFRDSNGFQHTWEPLHIDQMVMHFDLLKGRGIFPNVPVRVGHPSFFGEDPMECVVGWHTALRAETRTSPVDGVDYHYLLASYTLLDEEAIKKYNAGLFVNRSAEVGSYVTNAESEFWPVYQGFAFVDIPAVEGLNTFSRGNGTSYSIMTSETKEEAPVSGTKQTTPAAAAAGTETTGEQTPAAPVAPPVADQTQHAAPQAQAFTFQIGGQPTTDFAAVQRHITTLETTIDEQKQAGRAAFVKSLAEGPSPKITAPQIPGLQEFAKGLSDEVFEQWKATWEVAPGSSIVASHGGGSGVQVPEPNAKSVEEEEIETLQGIVAHHKRSGMSDNELKETSSYKRLQALTAKKS